MFFVNRGVLAVGLVLAVVLPVSDVVGPVSYTHLTLPTILLV